MQAIGSAPSLYGRLGALRFGMSRDEVAAAAPDLFDPKRAGIDGLLVGIVFDRAGGLEEVAMHFLTPQKGALRGLSAAWGEPATCGSPLKMMKGQHQFVWHDPTEGVRAILRVSGASGALHLSTYTPLTELLGEAGEPFGFEGPAPLLGASVEALRRAYGDRLVEDGHRRTLMLPPTEFADAAPLALAVSRGRVTGYSFELSYAMCAQSRDALLAALREKFGTFAPPQPGGSPETLQARPRVTVRDDGRGLTIRVSETGGK